MICRSDLTFRSTHRSSLAATLTAGMVGHSDHAITIGTFYHNLHHLSFQTSAYTYVFVICLIRHTPSNPCTCILCTVHRLHRFILAKDTTNSRFQTFCGTLEDYKILPVTNSSLASGPRICQIIRWTQRQDAQVETAYSTLRYIVATVHPCGCWERPRGPCYCAEVEPPGYYIWFPGKFRHDCLLRSLHLSVNENTRSPNLH